MNWDLHTYSGVFVNDYLWFSNNTFNGLFRFDFNNNKIEFMDFFPNELINQINTHKKCFVYNNKLVFLPALGNFISIYDIEEKSFNTIELGFATNNNCDKVADAVLIKNQLYIVPISQNDDLAVLNIDNYTITIVPEFMQSIKHSCNLHEGFLVTRCSLTEDNLLE